MVADIELVTCENNKDMLSILSLYGKAPTACNIMDIRMKCRAFREVKTWKPHTGMNFCLYLEMYFGWKKKVQEQTGS